MEWKQDWVFVFHAFRAQKHSTDIFGFFSLFPMLLRWLGVYHFTASFYLTPAEIGSWKTQVRSHIFLRHDGGKQFRPVYYRSWMDG